MVFEKYMRYIYRTMLGNQLYDSQANFNVTAPFSEGEYDTFLIFHPNFAVKVRLFLSRILFVHIIIFDFMFYMSDLYFDKRPTQPL